MNVHVLRLKMEFFEKSIWKKKDSEKRLELKFEKQKSIKS